MEEQVKKVNPVMDFLMKTLNGMAHGLFATLIVGTIFGAIGYLFNFGAGNQFCDFMVSILGKSGAHIGLSELLQVLTGAGIGIGIALSLKFNPLQTVVLAAVGQTAGYFALGTKFVTDGVTNMGTWQIGDPLTIYLVCISVALAMKYIIRKKTPVDIIIIPLLGMSLGLTSSLLIRYPAIYVTYGIQWLIQEGTNYIPFFMGIVVAVLMGMALTAPISSAAIGAMIFTNAGSNQALAIASGAAIVGCTAQMVGFAIQSIRDNKAGMVISIGIGTSMLQFKNILKKPIIWLPTIIASAILGPISTCLVQVQCFGANAGMGTAGLVGPIMTVIDMMGQGSDAWRIIVGVLLLEIVAPAVLVYFIDLLFRKLGWIKPGDLAV